MTKSLAIDYAESKIVVNALCPGFFNSAMTQHLFSDDIATSYMKSVTPYWKNEGGNIEDIAKAALFLASEDAAWITGTALAVDGGFSA